MSSKQLNNMRSININRHSNSRNSSRPSSSATSMISLQAKKAVNIGRRTGEIVKKGNSGLNYDGTEKLEDYFRKPKRLSLESESDIDEDIDKESLKNPIKQVRESDKINVSSLSDCEDESFVKQYEATHKRDRLSDFGLSPSPENSILSVIDPNNQRYQQNTNNNNMVNDLRKVDFGNKWIIQTRIGYPQSLPSNQGAELKNKDSEKNNLLDVSSRKTSSFRARRESQKPAASSKQVHSKGLSSIGKQAEQLSDVSSDRLDDLELLRQISNLSPELIANQFKQQQSQVTPFSHQKYSNIDDLLFSLSPSDIKQSEDKQNHLGQSPKDNGTFKRQEQYILGKDIQLNENLLRLQQRINNMENVNFTDVNQGNKDKYKKHSLNQSRKDDLSHRISVFDAGNQKITADQDSDDLEIKYDSDEEISKWLNDNRRLIKEMSIRKKSANKSGFNSTNKSDFLLDISESLIVKNERFSDQAKKLTQLSFIEEINTQQENNNQQYYINANEAVQIEKQKNKVEEGKWKKDQIDKDLEISMSVSGYQNESLQKVVDKSREKVEQIKDLKKKSLDVKAGFQSQQIHHSEHKYDGDKQANGQLKSLESENIDQENRIFEIEESLNLQLKQNKLTNEMRNNKLQAGSSQKSSIINTKVDILKGKEGIQRPSMIADKVLDKEELYKSQNKNGAIIGKQNSGILSRHQQDDLKNKEDTTSSSSESYQFDKLGQLQQAREEEMILEKKENKQNSSINHSMEVERNHKGDYNNDVRVDDQYQDYIEQQQQTVEDSQIQNSEDKEENIEQRQRGNNKRKRITPIKKRNLSNNSSSSSSSEYTEISSKKLKKLKNPYVLPKSLTKQDNSTSDASSSLTQSQNIDSSYSYLEKSKVQKKKKKKSTDNSPEYMKIFERGFHKDQVEHQVYNEQANFGKEGRYPVRKRIRPLLGWCERAVYGKQGLLYIIADSNTDNLTSVNYRIKDFSNLPQSRHIKASRNNSRNTSNDRKYKNNHLDNDTSLQEIKEIIDEPEESKGKYAKNEKQREININGKQGLGEQKKENMTHKDQINEKEKKILRENNLSKENRQGNKQKEDQLSNQGNNQKLKKDQQIKKVDQQNKKDYEDEKEVLKKRLLDQNQDKSIEKKKNQGNKLKIPVNEKKNQKKTKSNDTSLISNSSIDLQEQQIQQQKKRSGSVEESIRQKKSQEKIVANRNKNKQNEYLATEVKRKQLHLDYIRSQLIGLEIDKIKFQKLSDIDGNEDQNTEFKGKNLSFNYSLAPGQSITRAENQSKDNMNNSKKNQNSSKGCKIEINVLECEPKKLILKLHGDLSTSSYLKTGDKKTLQKSIQFTILHRNSTFNQSESMLQEAVINFTLNPASSDTKKQLQQ